VRHNVSAAQQARLGKMTDFERYVWHIRRTYRTLAIPVLVALAAIAYRRWMSLPWGLPDIASALVALMPIALGWWTSYELGVYRRVQLAQFRARPDRVIALLPALRKVLLRTMGKTAASVIVAEWHAKALARLGRRDEALAKVDTLAADPTVSAYRYHLSRALVYSALRDHPGMLREHELAIEADPAQPLALLGAAEVLAVHLGRPAEARAYMDAARKFPASPDTRPYFRWVQGAIHLAEGRASAARKAIEEAIDHFEKVSRATPSARGYVMVMRSFLCRACAASGDHVEARKQFDLARGFLELHKMDTLLEPCRRAVFEESVTRPRDS
jgi:tetratricopeptide (TPR) repeat protein